MSTSQIIVYVLAGLGTLSVTATSLSWLPGKAGKIAKAIGADLAGLLAVFKEVDPALPQEEEKKP